MNDSLYEKRKNKLTKYYRRFKQLPSYDELTSLFGLKSKGSLYKYVQKFISDGLLQKGGGGQLVPTSKLFGLRVLGSVQAGFPTAAEEELSDTMSLDEYLIDSPSSTYLLTVAGDSMQDAGIVAGDMVIVDKGRTPRRGDIVVAEIDGDWTVKYMEKNGRQVFLRAANKKYPDIYPQAEMKIGGVVTSVIRKYG